MKKGTREIPGFSGYQVDRKGVVYSTKKGAPRRLSVWVSPTGYQYVNLWIDGRRRAGIVHRLVMLAWAKPVDGKTEVNHINGEKADNRLENLEWSDRRSNINHAIQKLGRRIGVCNRQLSPSVVRKIRAMGAAGKMQKDIAQAFGLGRSHVGQIINRNLWRDLP